jgi:hypothetical protein
MDFFIWEIDAIIVVVNEDLSFNLQFYFIFDKFKFFLRSGFLLKIVITI